MKILVIGGSYFLGKAFVTEAKNVHEMTLINRGNRPYRDEKIKEYKIDRRDQKALAALEDQQYDAVVDFCAYEKGDISLFLAYSKIKTKQYIFISTCDVYQKGTGHILKEEEPFETRVFAGQEGAYICGKVALEKELSEVADKYDIHVTSIRPVFIYGPENYADRESVYFRWIMQAKQILHPVDATGQFQMVYVKDVAKAILCTLGNPKAYGKAFNLCRPELMTYDTFYEMLAALFEGTFEKVDIEVDTVLARQIPLPFPLLKEESEWYDGSAIESIGFSYTELLDGMRETLAWFQANWR